MRQKGRVLNCIPSQGTETDWSFEDAGALVNAKAPSSFDLRESWWSIKEQGKNGACVGYAAADGILRWHFVKSGAIEKAQELSIRFIWMANKETDELETYPTTFLDRAGTQTKLALRIALKFGCVLEELLPMQGGPLSDLEPDDFYEIAAKLRIKSYHSLKLNFAHWRQWIAHNGPILARVDVDTAWLDLAKHGELKTYRGKVGQQNTGHAICIVGYSLKHFIVRNSWGTPWGDAGYAYVSEKYAEAAFSDVYGVLA